MAWRRASGADLRPLHAFLEGREPFAAGFIGKLLSQGRLLLPAALRGGVWVRGDHPSRVEAAVLGLPGGLWFPQLPRGEADIPGLAPVLEATCGSALAQRDRRPTSLIGPAKSVLAFGSAIGFESEWRVGYRLMYREAPGTRPSANGSHPWPTSGLGLDAGDGVLARRCGPADLEALFPLQRAYEEEEVVTPLHDFDPEGCRASLAKSLRDQVVAGLARQEPGREAGRETRREGRTELIAKAGTNARAFTMDQIGGVFVLPEARGRGFGRRLMLYLLGLTALEGRSSSLFVKASNAPALALYAGIGYEEIDDFLADYRSPR
jgi:GNAT superfamily N-acetyltransferase